MQMTVSKYVNRIVLAAFLLLFGALPFSGLLGQQPAEVPLNDDSDWWSVTNGKGSGLDDQAQDGALKSQVREIAEGNFRILGMDIREGALEQAGKELGDAAEMDRGDAATGRAQKCYISPAPKDKTYFIVEEGEVNKAFYLFSEAAPWTGFEYCFRTSKIKRKMATASGLKLGLTPQEVIHILGKPSIQRQDELQYLLEFNKKTSPEELARLRKAKPNLSDEEIMLDFGSYDITVFIRAKFVHSKMEYLVISESETR
jgi:hypothetical protein